MMAANGELGVKRCRGSVGPRMFRKFACQAIPERRPLLVGVGKLPQQQHHHQYNGGCRLDGSVEGLPYIAHMAHASMLPNRYSKTLWPDFVQHRSRPQRLLVLHKTADRHGQQAAELCVEQQRPVPQPGH